MTVELLYFNGINGESGSYDLPPMTGLELSGFIKGEKEPKNLNELRFRHQQATSRTLGVKEGVDPLKLSESGWGVIFASDADPSIKDALQELIDLRHQQAGVYFKLYEGPEGYRHGESKTDFLARHGVGPGPADPDNMPYYLLIVGSPEQIPYQFQSQLDVQYAVGRIYFDTTQEYANYARSVVACERGEVKLPRQAAFFGVANKDDPATQLSSTSLVGPLQTKFKTNLTDWQVSGFLEASATKAQLARLLGGDQTPALLFSGSHGMSFPIGSERQIPHQGALLCQDWPGPEDWRGKGPIPHDFYFAGDDLSVDAGLLGMVAFFFACYGAGTPLNDEFSEQAFKQRTAIAQHPFIAQLPMKLLAHPRGGALAVVGHVERAWSYSFMWQKAGVQTAVFETSLTRLFKGHPVGSAFESFNARYAELSTVLSDELHDIKFGKIADPYELAGMWTANNDARGYSIIGDPAVRVPISLAGETDVRRPSFEIITPAAPPSAKTVNPAAPVAAPAQSETQPAIVGKGTSPVSAQPPTQVAGAAPYAPQATLSAVDFGLIDSLNDVRQQLTASLQTFADNLGKTLVKVVDDLSTLDVTTYVSQDVAGAVVDLSKRELRAFTRIKIDGDTEVVVPQTDGKIDRELWQIHLSMVQQAQANRAEMMKAAAEAATGLLQALKVI